MARGKPQHRTQPLADAWGVNYVRTSRDEASKGGAYSIDGQIAENARKFDKRSDVKVYRDDGESGTSLHRPAFEKLEADIKAGRVRKVVAWRPDRLARMGPEDVLPTLRLWRSYGVEIDFVSWDYDDETPEGLLNLRIMLTIAAYEAQSINARMSLGRREKAKSGQIPTGVAVPYGYRYAHVDGRAVYVIEPREAAIVERIFSSVREGVSIKGVCRLLNDDGVSTPTRTAKQKRALRWERALVRQILKREMYATGIKYCGKFKLRLDKSVDFKTRPESEWIAVKVPTIIDRALFDSARARLTKNREQLQGRPPMAPSLLHGIGVCQCGRRLSAQRRGDRHDVLYRCSSREGIGECKQKNTWSALRVDEQIWQAFVDYTNDPSIVLADIEALARDEHETWVEQRETCDRALHALDDERVYNMKQLRAGRFTEDFFDEADREIKRRSEKLTNDLTRLEGLLQTSVDRRWAKRFALSQRADVARLTDTARRAEYLRQVCTSVTLEGEVAQMVVMAHPDTQEKLRTATSHSTQLSRTADQALSAHPTVTITVSLVYKARRTSNKAPHSRISRGAR